MFKLNVPDWERVIRGVVGVAMTAGGAWWAFSGDLLWGGLLAASGIGLAATAIVGWCPFCAMAGRKLPQVDKKVVIARL